jgi:hypothetical protein
MVRRIAARFRETFNASGIAGVGQDVLKCYDDRLTEPASMRECVVYDTAALIFDRSMMQVFTARGMNAVAAPLFTNEVFDARQTTYGRLAFKGDPQDRELVGPAAQKVVGKVWP